MPRNHLGDVVSFVQPDVLVALLREDLDHAVVSLYPLVRSIHGEQAFEEGVYEDVVGAEKFVGLPELAFGDVRVDPLVDEPEGVDHRASGVVADGADLYLGL